MMNVIARLGLIVGLLDHCSSHIFRLKFTLKTHVTIASSSLWRCQAFRDFWIEIFKERSPVRARAHLDAWLRVASNSKNRRGQCVKLNKTLLLVMCIELSYLFLQVPETLFKLQIYVIA